MDEFMNLGLFDTDSVSMRPFDILDTSGIQLTHSNYRKTKQSMIAAVFIYVESMYEICFPSSDPHQLGLGPPGVGCCLHLGRPFGGALRV